MKNIFFIVMLLPFIINAASKKINILNGKIKIDVTDSNTILLIKFKKKFAEKDVHIKDNGAYLQVNLSNTIAPDSGGFYNGKGEFIKKIAFFQKTADDAALRIFVTKNTKALLKSSRIEMLGNTLAISFDHKVIYQVLDNKYVVNSKTLHSRHNEKSIIATKVPKLENKIKSLAIFAALFFVFIAIVLMMKPLIMKLKIKKNKENGIIDLINMQTLDQIVISAKQKILLIEASGEKILVGVTPENISLISKITQVNKHQHTTANSADKKQVQNSTKLDSNTFSELLSTVDSKKVVEKYKNLTSKKDTKSKKTTSNKKHTAKFKSQIKENTEKDLFDGNKSPIEEVTNLIRNRLNKKV